MVECQTSWVILSPDLHRRDGVWTCPGGGYVGGACPGGEEYTEIGDSDERRHWFENAARKISVALPKARNAGGPTTIVTGNFALTIDLSTRGLGHVVYCVRESSRAAQLQELGHEAFHRVDTADSSKGSWAKEMLAEHFSVELLREAGNKQGEDARREKHLLADGFDPRSLLSLDGIRAEDARTYAALYVIAGQLVDAVGLDAVAELALADGQGFQPKVNAWVERLDAGAQTRVRSILRFGAS